MVSISVFIPSPLVFGFRPFSVSVSCLTLCLSTTETCLECSRLSTPNSLSSLWQLVQLLKWCLFLPLEVTFIQSFLQNLSFRVPCNHETFILRFTSISLLFDVDIGILECITSVNYTFSRNLPLHSGI